MKQFERTEKLIGAEAQRKLARSNVAVFGLGGVGSYVVEALARAGVGKLTLVDFDVVDETNINRQLFALHSTIGLPKTAVAKSRIADINPDAEVVIFNRRFDAQTMGEFDFDCFDYVVDAIDMVTSKLLLAEICTKKSVPVISSMGTGNKLDPTAFKVADIFRTNVCPLAKVMRRELKKRGINSLKVVYSEESPSKPIEPSAETNSADSACLRNSVRADDLCADVLAKSAHSHLKATPASISFVPSAAGLIIAGEVVKALIG